MSSFNDPAPLRLRFIGGLLAALLILAAFVAEGMRSKHQVMMELFGTPRASLTVSLIGVDEEGRIRPEYAACRTGAGRNVITGSVNRNLGVRWSNVPVGTSSFVVLMVRSDRPGKTAPLSSYQPREMAGQERIPTWPMFFHWIVIDIPGHFRELPAGAMSPEPQSSRQFGREGVNDGFDSPNVRYVGYRGPCRSARELPNVVNNYQVHVFGVAVPYLDLPEDYFDGRELLVKLPQHVTSQGVAAATYSLNLAAW